MKLLECLTLEALNAQLVAAIVLILERAICVRGRAYLAVSGGASPQALYQLLATKPLMWSQVTIVLTDERCVALSHIDSNERMIREHLLIHHAKAAKLLSFYQPNNQSFIATTQLNQTLVALPLFDAVILGMGTDGHTASLFPCTNEIEQGLFDEDTAIMTLKPVTAPHKRLTLTKSRLLKTWHLFLYLIGEKKITALTQALAGTNVEVMPIRAFLFDPTIDMQVMFTTWDNHLNKA